MSVNINDLSTTLYANIYRPWGLSEIYVIQYTDIEHILHSLLHTNDINNSPRGR